jgi:hypothetical protein
MRKARQGALKQSQVQKPTQAVYGFQQSSSFAIVNNWCKSQFTSNFNKNLDHPEI